MGLITVTRLESWFADQLQDLNCSPETLAYVVGVLKALGQPKAGEDMSKQSVIMAYQAASMSGEFAGFQKLGDWVLWTDVVCPDFVDVNRQVFESFGQLSYLSCHKILRGQWHVFEELANELPSIASRVRRKLV
jgi:hypothetical protein